MKRLQFEKKHRSEFDRWLDGEKHEGLAQTSAALTSQISGSLTVNYRSINWVNLEIEEVKRTLQTWRTREFEVSSSLPCSSIEGHF